jgi:hypothetical protein
MMGCFEMDVDVKPNFKVVETMPGLGAILDCNLASHNNTRTFPSYQGSDLLLE